MLSRLSFDPLDGVILKKQPPIENLCQSCDGQFEPAKIIKYSPNEIIVEANITHAGFLVLSENDYPGWKAYVDGERQRIYNAYHTLRAVYLDAGFHIVRFTYESDSLRTGSWISFLTSIFLIGTISMKRIPHLRRGKKSQK